MYPGRADMLCPISTVRFVPSPDLGARNRYVWLTSMGGRRKRDR